MTGRLSKFLCAILSLAMTLPPGIFTAARAEAGDVNSPPGLSIVVAPVADGDLDGQSEEFASAICDALRISSVHRVVDSSLSAKVISYHGSKAEAKPHEGGAAEALSAAKEHYFAFRYEKARADLDRAIREFESRPERISYEGSMLLDAYLTRAVIARSTGEEALARRSISSALTIDPNLALQKGEYPPGLVAILDGERARREASESGELNVLTKPEVAEIYVNGIRQGVTPLNLKLPAGRFRVLIRANRYSDIEREVYVKPGVGTELKEKLRWARGGKPQKPGRMDAEGEVREGLRIASMMKADKVILVNADASDDGALISARMVDGALRVGQPPVVAKMSAGVSSKALAQITSRLASQAGADLISNPWRNTDQRGTADAALFAKRKKPLHKNPAFWVVVGAIVAGGLGGGLAAAFSGGSGDRGDVRVRFR